jgi:hypothetical protein
MQWYALLLLLTFTHLTFLVLRECTEDHGIGPILYYRPQDQLVRLCTRRCYRRRKENVSLFFSIGCNEPWL